MYRLVRQPVTLHYSMSNYRYWMLDENNTVVLPVRQYIYYSAKEIIDMVRTMVGKGKDFRVTNIVLDDKQFAKCELVTTFSSAEELLYDCPELLI